VLRRHSLNSSRWKQRPLFLSVTARRGNPDRSVGPAAELIRRRRAMCLAVMLPFASKGCTPCLERDPRSTTTCSFGAYEDDYLFEIRSQPDGKGPYTIYCRRHPRNLHDTADVRTQLIQRLAA